MAHQMALLSKALKRNMKLLLSKPEQNSGNATGDY